MPLPPPLPPGRVVPPAVQARGVAGDAAVVMAKWAAVAGLMTVLPWPWNAVASAVTMGAMAVWGGVRILAHFLTENQDRYGAKYHIYMNRIDRGLDDLATLRRDGHVAPHERARRYREITTQMRRTFGFLEEMRDCDPSRVYARGYLMGPLFLAVTVMALRKPCTDEQNREVLERYGREDDIRSYRRLLDRLPSEMPALPPEPEDDGGYRVLPARYRVEVPKEFDDFEDDLAAIEQERPKTKALPRPSENPHDTSRKR